MDFAAPAALAGAYFAAAQARTAIDGVKIGEAAMKRANELTRLPVTNFVPVRDQNGNNLYINKYGSILHTTGEVDHDEWTLLYGRVAS